MGKWAKIEISLLPQGFFVATFVFKSGQKPGKSGLYKNLTFLKFSKTQKKWAKARFCKPKVGIKIGNFSHSKTKREGLVRPSQSIERFRIHP